MCKDYPTVQNTIIPEECTYYFVGCERRGKCDCKISACCNVPRIDGNPESPPMSLKSGGQPCKFLVWVDSDEVEKTSSVASSVNDHEFIYKDLEEGIRGDKG
jgi:hypothetical protein